MPRDTQFFYELTSGDRLRIRFIVDHGEVVDFVVQYETLADDEFRPVARYDGSHGQGHLDVLDWNGDTIDKRWLPDTMTLADCFNYAQRELRANWKYYRDRFIERRTSVHPPEMGQ